MLYLTKDGGGAVGAIVAAISSAVKVSGVEVKLTQDTLTATLTLGDAKASSAVPVSKPRKSSGSSKKPPRKFSTLGEVTFNGETLSIKRWAEKIGMTESGVRYRVGRYGNPYGLKGPTDADKVVAGASV